MKYSSFITFQRIVFVLPCLIQISNINLNQASKDICKHKKKTQMKESHQKQNLFRGLSRNTHIAFL